MKILKDFDLTPYNTFGVQAMASSYVEINSIEELSDLYKQGYFEPGRFLIMGQGSNLLFTGDYEGLVIRIVSDDIFCDQHGDKVFVKASAGVDWDSLVKKCTLSGYYGIENLVSIPGCVGAAPVQNIGAYGVELKDVLQEVVAFNISSGKVVRLSNADCSFEYRDSIFKKDGFNTYIILEVTLELSTDAEPNFKYGNITDALNTKSISNPTNVDVMEAIIEIRESKLPDPKKLGNAGSFFKNPVIAKDHYDNLNAKYQNVPGYLIEDGLIKVPAGWLIEKAGWKGKRIGNVGIHENQALVLVNHGGANGNDIVQLSSKIINDVWGKFGIEITPEVRFV